MRVGLALIGFGLAGLPLLAPGAEPAPTNAPRIFCEQPVYDFGRQDNTQEVVHTYMLRNTGTAPLAILRVQPSCGCTTAQLTTNVLNPGQGAELTARLSLRGRSGLQHKNIFIECNDPLAPSYRLELKGTAFLEVEARPQFAQFGVLTTNAAFERLVMIECNSAFPFHITNCVTKPDCLTATCEPVTEGKIYRLRVVVSNPPLGSLHGLIRLQTDHPGYPMIEVPAFGFARTNRPTL